MLNKSQIAKSVRDIISSEMDILVLRGDEEGARKGGDIDFLVPQGNAKRAAEIIATTAKANGWGVYGTHDLGYVVQICLIIPGETSCADKAVKLDFSNGLSWYNLGTDRIGSVLFRALREGQDPLKLAKIASFFQKILYPGYLRPKDSFRITYNNEMEHLHEFCVELDLKIPTSAIQAGRVNTRTKWALRRQSADVSRLKVLVWVALAIKQAIGTRLRMITSPTLIVGVSGMDGSGKSTLIDRFVSAIKDSEFSDPILVHLLPPLIPMPHQIFKKKSTKTNYTSPYSELPVKSKLSAALRVIYYAVAFTLSKLWCICKMRSGRVIIFDRSIVDFSIDLSRARIPHFEISNVLVRFLLPPGIFFYLDAAPQTVVERKGELELEKARELSTRYNRIVQSQIVQHLDGEKNTNEVYQRFLCAVTCEVMKRL